jgi:PhzF family phenazine biosynthesis protein
MGQKITVVDSFADRPFAGNPAAVCVLPEERDPGWMQLVAREMNLSETAFLVRRKDGWSLRWFTPRAEVDLCGHATLASAHVLWQEGHLDEGEAARFHTHTGLLTATRRGEWIELDFPATPDAPAAEPDGLSSALGATPRYVGTTEFDTFVEVENEAVLRALRPDMRRLAALGKRGVIVTAVADVRPGAARYDFVSRFFAPGVGVDEDPVTGSAHCALGPYWAERMGKIVLVGYQCSARGGVVRIEVRGDRVILGGQAITMLHSELVSL